jgi:phage-related protein
MKIEKVYGFSRIYQAETFQDDFDAMFGKNKGERKRYILWLYTWLAILDDLGQNALALQQFEHLQNTDNPHLYALRHPHSKINERYIYVYADGEAAILLTAFKEKSSSDYGAAIDCAKRIYMELEENDDGDS